jgi:hypothetical protein
MPHGGRQSPDPAPRSPVKLRQQAALARRWAAGMPGQADQSALSALADSLEAEAAELEQDGGQRRGRAHAAERAQKELSTSLDHTALTRRWSVGSFPAERYSILYRPHRSRPLADRPPWTERMMSR